MKKFLAVIILLAFVSVDGASAARTIKNCRGLPLESLRSGVSRKFYKSLEISPIDAWIVARTPLVNSNASGAKIIQSDAGGIYDTMALEIANSMHVSGLNRTESQLHLSELMVHLLIYKIADGLMAVSFSHVDEARYAGYRQYGRATIAFFRNGKWTVMPTGKEK